MKKEEILTYLSNNKILFQKQFNITKIGIYGSFADDKQTEKSDIDIVIEMPRGTENVFEYKQLLKQLLQKQFNRQIDICRESAIKPIFRDLILKNAIYV